MAARHHRKNHDVKQTKKIAPFITRDTFLGQHVCEMVFGVHTFELDLGVHACFVKQPIQRDSVESGHVSHLWTSSKDDHLDHLVVFKNVQLRFN